MDATDHPVHLRLWSVSAFRTLSFTVAVAFGFHLRGTLRESLASLDTTIGLAALAMLWTTTVVASRAGYRYFQHQQTTPRYSASRFESTIVAGALNGACVYGVLAIAAIIAVHTPQATAAIAVFSVVGVAVATVVGGFVGISYGAIEALLLRVGRGLVSTDEENATIVTS